MPFLYVGIFFAYLEVWSYVLTLFDPSMVPHVNNGFRALAAAVVLYSIERSLFEYVKDLAGRIDAAQVQRAQRGRS